MLKFEVKSSECKARDLLSRGRTLTFHDQLVTMTKGEEVRVIRLTHRTVDQALKPGVYALDLEASLSVDQWGGLMLRNPVLRPVTQTAAR